MTATGARNRCWARSPAAPGDAVAVSTEPRGPPGPAPAPGDARDICRRPARPPPIEQCAPPWGPLLLAASLASRAKRSRRLPNPTGPPQDPEQRRLDASAAAGPPPMPLGGCSGFPGRPLFRVFEDSRPWQALQSTRGPQRGRPGSRPRPAPRARSNVAAAGQVELRERQTPRVEREQRDREARRK